MPSSPGNEDPSAIGSKLHYMINSMMSPKPPPLAALPEAQEPSARPSRDDVRAAASSVDSDYPADIFEDKNVKTAVETFQDKPEEIPDDQSKNSSTKYEESCSSSVELQRLQDAFHGRLVPGTFHKRLRIKNLTLTPKPPQQVLVLESGDAGSIVLKSTVSKSLKMSASRSGEDIQTLSNLCNSRLDWNISNIPMQVATVGYAFPEYNTALCKKKLAIKSLDNILKLGITSSSTSTKIKRSHKTSQCSKGTLESHSKQDKREAVGATEKNTEVAVFKKNQLSPASVATDVDLAVEKPCGARTSITDVQRTLKEVEHIKDTQDSVDCTSSLDMLVGILNEIQKITTCHMTKYSEICADEHECKEVETMLTKEAAALSVKISDSHELVSIASLDKLRQLESSPSIYSLYLSNDERDSINSLGVSRLKTSMNSVLCNSKPHSADKEVSADFPVRELTNTFTEVPSKFFPITITHSTNVSSSLVGLKSKPSSQTVISLHDYTAFDSFGCGQNILEVSSSNAQKGMLMIEYPANGKTENPVKIIKDVSERMKSIEGRITTENNVFSKQTKCCLNSSDLDPTIKLKRDILVTVYSMLVLTVFAALSFPDLLYHV